MRAALQAFQLRQNLQRGGCELRWVASDYDLGDSVTKKKPESREGLLKLLATGHWSIAYDPQFVAAKKNRKVGLTAIDKVDKALEPYDSLDSSEVPADLQQYLVSFMSNLDNDQDPNFFFARALSLALNTG